MTRAINNLTYLFT